MEGGGQPLLALCPCQEEDEDEDSLCWTCACGGQRTRNVDSLCWLRGCARPADQVDWEGRNGRLSLPALCPQDGTTTLLAVVPKIRGRYASGIMPADELG